MTQQKLPTSQDGRHFKPPHLETDKPIDMEIDSESINYKDEDPWYWCWGKKELTRSHLPLLKPQLSWRTGHGREPPTLWRTPWRRSRPSSQSLLLRRSRSLSQSPLPRTLFLSLLSLFLLVFLFLLSPFGIVCDSFPVTPAKNIVAYLLALNVFISKIGKKKKILITRN